jgi:hypothetical protein
VRPTAGSGSKKARRRPKRNFLEVCVFLGRSLKAPQIRRVVEASKSKRVPIIHIRHRDEVEAPIFGGTTQFIVAWLIDSTKDPMVPAWYQIVANVASIVGVMLLMPHADVVRERKAHLAAGA